MPEIGLDRACVVAIVGELVAAGVAQHVGMLPCERISGRSLTTSTDLVVSQHCVFERSVARG
jgi:hypothetical protein